MAEEMFDVFVYGSLKAGLQNNYLLADSEFIGCDQTKDKYLMFSLGWFPGVIKKRKEHHIGGELYRVDKKTLELLDYLEGNGSFYQRELVELAGHNNKAWMYLIMDDVDETPSFDNESDIVIYNSCAKWIG